ncbi:MAG: hypothetical protein LQ343_000259 [Gyalolechia ehrenbergii]|nr:MAG: hypothetical protein LQ343_000259 [Gyalolechia ehrenbergii]
MEEEDDPVMLTIRFLDYRYIRFCFHPLKDKFMLCSDWKDSNWIDVRSIRAGLDSDERHRREQVFGKNQIDIKQKSIPQLLVDEVSSLQYMLGCCINSSKVFHPFYVFQICSLILWSLDEYYYYAVCIFLISIVSITTTLFETRSTMKRLREISRFECDIRVIRNGFWRQIPSAELVPGDVYEVSDPSLTQLPCDSLLLAGDCIVNESMLTGESVPVSKLPATNESLRVLDLRLSSISPEAAKHFLFGGTKIIRARRPQDGKDEEAVALAIVARTGFDTTKGALVRSMLFPKPSGFKFYKDAFRYISVMAGVAGAGFVASFINFVRLELAWHLIIVRALDLITIVVPPALPATLTIGINFALSRLRSKSIFCISPQRVNVGGKLDVICFDKTGTLTEEGLDVLGVRVVHRPAMRFSDLLSSSSTLLPGAAYERDPTVDYGVHKAVLHTMASCHSIRTVDGELVGDPLDLKMFEFTGWTFEEGSQDPFYVQNGGARLQDCSLVKPPAGSEFDPHETEGSDVGMAIQLSIIKGFEFASHLRRASIIVSQAGSQMAEVFVKGAPECMKAICKLESFPIDYEDLLDFYTHRGFRVIASATKQLPYDRNLLQDLDRDRAESELEFIGFIIFENKLKSATADTIEELEQAGIRQIMCTGDNILTAISVAKECSLINRTGHCFVPHLIEGDTQDPNARLTWQSVDNPLLKLDERTLTPLPPLAEGDVSLPYDMSNLRNYSLAITGDIFRWIINFADEIILQRVLVASQVFARISPDEKHALVERLQAIGYCCGFCGDGANDCGALKAADVGISLSEAEASVAAPFTSRVFDISCVPEVIRGLDGAFPSPMSQETHGESRFSQGPYAIAGSNGGYLPQTVIRYGIRAQLGDRIKSVESTCLEDAYKHKMDYVEALRTRPMAIETATANAQHYEVGTGVLQACLGPRMKYSCCLYPTGGETLGQAEIEMLDTYVEKADLVDGMSILDLGCGWGSAALYFAETLPHSRVTAFSNSRTQKTYIDQQASLKGLENLKVITGDVVNYTFESDSFDRVVSIELFEHMKNYELLMAKIATALRPGGKLFVHIFSHKTSPYDFEEGWMSTHFFSGGTMPSADLLHYFQRDLTLTNQWWVSGKHYAKTCEDWLIEMTNNKKSIWPHLEATYGKDNAGVWYQRWQIFYMACAELFAYEGGDTWGVSHYLFEKDLAR